jgi:hypothetical protein
MTSLSTVRLILLALAGILVAAGVAVLAGHLASQQIGLASEPISAGEELAPAIARPHHGEHGTKASEQSSGSRGSGGSAPAGDAPAVPPATAGSDSPAGGEAPSSGDDYGGGVRQRLDGGAGDGDD